MEKEDWQRIAKWIGLGYLPIIILIVIVYVLVQMNVKNIHEQQQQELNNSVVASSTE